MQNKAQGQRNTNVLNYQKEINS